MTRTSTILLITVAILGGCSREREATPLDTTRADSATAVSVDSAAASRPASGFPMVGIAVLDTTSAWCAAFPPDSASRAPAVGDTVAIVFASSEGPVALRGRIAAARSAPCHAEFAQSRWDGYHAFDLGLTEPRPDGDISSVALAVLGSASWSRQDGRVLADIDGDGVSEEARRCTADEGEHFTIWSVAAGATPIRRAHEYYDWGAFTDPTCKPGEDGR